MTGIKENLAAVEDRINRACRSIGRRREEITLVAVTKTVSSAQIEEAIMLGLIHLGENKIQEAQEKRAAIDEFSAGAANPTWHMIGHLQTNKVKQALRLFDIIESVDSLKLAKTIAQEAAKLGLTPDVLLEVNSSGEPGKFGFDPAETIQAALEISKLDNLKLCGLMTIGPLTDDFSKIDRAFSLVQKLQTQLKSILGDRINILSMGMSADFELAIKNSATQVRLGTAIFGSRG